MKLIKYKNLTEDLQVLWHAEKLVSHNEVRKVKEQQARECPVCSLFAGIRKRM